jgi:gamma-glutamyltranspeptidase/glutathione hydrolase
MIEAKKLAFEDRAKFYADPEFSKIPLKGLLSKAYAAERRQLIGERAGRSYDAGNPALQDGDTICLSTADAAGNMVSLIQSNYRGFGSGIVVPGLGFCFQDRGEMFTMHDPAHANAYAPGKRPFHTIIPAFITKDGRPWLSFGLMGGAMQPQGHVQIVCNLIDFGMNFQEAGDAARWMHEGSSDYNNPRMTDGGWVELESGVPYESARELARRGHSIRAGTGNFGGYQAIHRDHANGTWIGASEARKDGHAAGY